VDKCIGGILGQLCEPRTKPRLDYVRMENVLKRTKMDYYKEAKDGNIGLYIRGFKPNTVTLIDRNILLEFYLVKQK
jgi:hypothetical protein